MNKTPATFPLRFCTGGCRNGAHHAHIYTVDPIDGPLTHEYLCPGNQGQVLELIDDEGEATLEGYITDEKQRVATEIITMAKDGDYIDADSSSAVSCLQDAQTQFTAGQFKLAIYWALRSLAYSVGITSSVYAYAWDLAGYTGESPRLPSIRDGVKGGN